ncbi:hypothetical protein AeMF1_019515 [Aphanomyces euteiches]|nr:hypothetical protein AeMF1_019515 [Aphanomyces euteiches]
MSEGKRKEVFRFKASTDVDLLREVMRIQTFAADYGQTGRRWEELSGYMCEIHGDGAVNAYSCRRRFEDLVSTDEEYNEREQLLQDIVDLMDATNNEKLEKKSSKLAKLKKREDDCDDVRRLAMIAMKRKRDSLDDDFEKSSSTAPIGSKKPIETMLVLKDYTTVAHESNNMQRESNDIARRRIELDEA